MRPLLLFCFLASWSFAAPQEFVSGQNRTHLLELFTSEGCSSCPPAEAWLSGLSNDPRLWRDIVPVAWHVDYWDNLGWKDRFASKAATQREYAYASRWQSDTVYTPCFAVDGTEYRTRTLPRPAAENTGILRAIVDGNRIEIRFDPTQSGAYEVHAVRLAMAVSSRVKAGENAGRELHHDFIASGATQTAPLREGAATLELPPTPPDGTDHHALAVWITRPGALTPLQAVGGMLQ